MAIIIIFHSFPNPRPLFRRLRAEGGEEEEEEEEEEEVDDNENEEDDEEDGNLSADSHSHGQVTPSQLVISRAHSTPDSCNGIASLASADTGKHVCIYVCAWRGVWGGVTTGKMMVDREIEIKTTTTATTTTTTTSTKTIVFEIINIMKYRHHGENFFFVGRTCTTEGNSVASDSS